MEKSGKTEEQHLHTAVFIIIVGLLMACHVSLVEQWRACIFLVFNLVLLAVVFTSFGRFADSNKHPRSSHKVENAQEEILRDQKIVAKHCRSFVTSIDAGGDDQCELAKKVEVSYYKEVEALDADLSEEELNRRSEAFITRFRQHLVADSRKRSRIVAANTTK